MKNHLYLFKGVLLLLFSLVFFQAKAQIINCTNHAFSNGNFSVTFNVQNTNANDILVTDISSAIFTGTAGTYTFSLLYNTAPVNSSGATWSQGIVGPGQNGWVAAGSATVTLPAHTAPQPVLT